MEVTRRFWAAVGAGGVLSILGLVFARPILVVGAGGIWGLVVGAQLVFVLRLLALDRSMTITQTLDSPFVTTRGTVRWSLEATLAQPTPLEVSIVPTFPVTLDVSKQPRVTIPPGETGGRADATVTATVAGTTTIPRPTVAVSGTWGLFGEQFRRGPTTDLTVEPRQVGDVHVGQGGESVIATPGGRHRTGEIGSGISPAEVREYVPGDTVSDIDWKATARLASPHVREFEVETDRQTVLLFDRRSRLESGPGGESMLAYLREVALRFVSAAANLDDPLGLYAIGDGGVTDEVMPRADERTYEHIRSRLQTATPTGGAETADASTAMEADLIGPGTARRNATRLREAASPYARSLHPFFADGTRYVRQIADRPLFGAGKAYLPRIDGEMWVVIFTDDRDRTEVRETVKLAREHGRRVVVFLAPGALFETELVGDLDAAYTSYRGFEEFRQTLAGLDRVEAYEVGPGDRVEALLSTRREQGGRQ